MKIVSSQLAAMIFKSIKYFMMKFLGYFSWLVKKAS